MRSDEPEKTNLNHSNLVARAYVFAGCGKQDPAQSLTLAEQMMSPASELSRAGLRRVWMRGVSRGRSPPPANHAEKEALVLCNEAHAGRIARFGARLVQLTLNLH